ncbi:MAG TPA: RDD family protein [Thermoanaerobaculia bacterium]|nr:RDD family protein [Thermoanaerobaculia bacterium]
MARNDPSPVLLRIAAFLADALVPAILLMLPAAAVSYGVVQVGAPMRYIALAWWGALAIFFLWILFRDGWRGRSPGKRLMALQILSGRGVGCGWGRSFARNLPLIVPGWNLLELILVLFSRSGRRSGDRIAGTTLVEE